MTKFNDNVRETGSLGFEPGRYLETQKKLGT